MDLKPEMQEKGSFTVVGLKYRGKVEDNKLPQLWGKLMGYMDAAADIVDFSAGYGVMGNYDETTGAFDYVAGWEKSADGDIPEGMVTWDVPAQTYAVFEVSLANLQEAYDYIYNTWLPQSGHQHAPGPEFEYYSSSFDNEDPTSPFTVYIPVS